MDQNKLNYQSKESISPQTEATPTVSTSDPLNQKTTETTTPAETVSPTKTTAPLPSSTETLPETPVAPPPPSSTPVVISKKDTPLPKWFYVIFVITLLAFFAGTFLLISTIRQRQTPLPQTSPSPFPTVTTSAKKVTPLPQKKKEITDPVILKLNSQGTSDEVKDLESDLENTDLSPIDQSIITLDEQMGFISEEKQ